MNELSQPDSGNEAEYARFQLRDAILASIDLEPGLVPNNFTYDDDLHGLTVPGSSGDTFRLAFFRAVSADPSDNVINRPPERAVAANAQYGLGLYGGNSIEAVAHYAWHEGRNVRLFLTPEIRKTDVLDFTIDQDAKLRNLEVLKRFTRSKVGVMRSKEASIHDQRVSQAYEDKELIILDKPIDVKLSQRLQGESFSYPANAIWYIWRGESNDGFEAVGAASHFPAQRRLAKFVVGKVMKPADSR